MDPVFDMDIADTIADAKTKYHEKTYDVIILDMNLPNGKGLATVDRVLEFCKSTPVLIISELDDEDLARRAVKKGIQDYLVKGQFNARGFKRAVSHALYRHDFRKNKSDIREHVKNQAIMRLRAVAEL
jgi:DNA-binding response OmpR family regulator